MVHHGGGDAVVAAVSRPLHRFVADDGRDFDRSWASRIACMFAAATRYKNYNTLHCTTVWGCPSALVSMRPMRHTCSPLALSDAMAASACRRRR